MKYITLLLLFFAPFWVQAQILSFYPDTIIVDESLVLDEYNLYQIDFVNETDDTLFLSWRMIENTVPDDWFLQLCDNSDCYGTVPAYENMNPFGPGQSAFIKLDVHPEMINGTGMIRILIYKTGGDILDNDGIEFHFTAGNPTATIAPGLSDFSVYPNPADESLFVDNQTQQDLMYSLCDGRGFGRIQGALSAGTNQQLDVSDLVSGMYYLMLHTGETTEVRKIFINR
ncbi:MAG: T9SS type A sorting domain-containing protein [Saprospiraceae bacterium]|nr:T9SS type A sorting domain-containing protein [Saprospiraceae bacterium]